MAKYKVCVLQKTSSRVSIARSEKANSEVASAVSICPNRHSP